MPTVNTHMHADHITGTGILKKMVPNCQSIISATSHADADIKVKHLDVIGLGRHEIEVRATPGHTDGNYFLKLSYSQ